MLEPKDFMDNKNDNVIAFSIAVVIVAWIIAGLILTSCNPVKKAYEGVAKYEPQTGKDSTNFYSRAKKLIKTPAPIVKPGKIVRVPFEKKVLDSNKLRKAIDSLNEAHDYDMEDLSLDCIKSVKEAKKQALKEGFEDGYAKGQLEYFLNHEETKYPDTVFIPDTSLIFQLDNCEVFLREAQGNNIAYKATIKVLEKRSRQLGLFLLLAAAIIGFLGFLTIRSRLKLKIPNV